MGLQTPRHLFLPGNEAADELARWETLLAPSAITCSPSSLISRIHSCLFSDWKRTVSLKFLDTQVPSISTEELVLPRHARCVLSRLRCNGHKFSVKLLSLQDWKNRALFMQRLRTLTPEHLLSHSALSSYGLFAHLALWQLSVSLRPLVQAMGSCPASSAPWCSAIFPPLGRGRVTTTTTATARF